MNGEVGQGNFVLWGLWYSNFSSNFLKD